MEQAEEAFQTAHLAYEIAIAHQQAMDHAENTIADKEASVKLANHEEYAGAKNNDVRELMLARWLEDDQEYQQARKDYRHAEQELRRAKMHISKLNLYANLLRAQTGGGADAL